MIQGDTSFVGCLGGKLHIGVPVRPGVYTMLQEGSSCLQNPSIPAWNGVCYVHAIHARQVVVIVHGAARADQL